MATTNFDDVQFGDKKAVNGAIEVVDEAARLALMKLPLGAEVFQADNEFYYKLRDADNADDAASWKPEPKISIFRLLQVGTTAPTITATLANNLSGVPVLTRSFAGLYTMTLAGAFPVNKTFAVYQSNSGGHTLGIDMTQAPNSLALITQVGEVWTDERLNGLLKIEIYP